MDDYLQDIIIITVIIFFSTLIIFILSGMVHEKNDKLWNEGHCDVCGGTWQYDQAVGYRDSTSYIYVCEDCGKRIEISEVR